MINQKTTACRLLPAIGKDVGDVVEIGGLLGSAPVMPVNRFSCDAFVNRGGRIPHLFIALKLVNNGIVYKHVLIRITYKYMLILKWYLTMTKIHA